MKKSAPKLQLHVDCMVKKEDLWCYIDNNIGNIKSISGVSRFFSKIEEKITDSLHDYIIDKLNEHTEIPIPIKKAIIKRVQSEMLGIPNTVIYKQKKDKRIGWARVIYTPMKG